MTKQWKQKTMKHFKTIAIILSLLFISSFGQSVFSAQTQTTYNYAKPENCIKLYEIPADRLFQLTLADLSANKFEVVEMQTRNGYIIFETEKDEFLINIIPKDKKHSFLKITPVNNSYYFSATIPEKIFNFINEKMNIPVEELKIN